jgi:hypothetical protein
MDSGINSDRLITYSASEDAANATEALPARVITIKLCDLCPNSFFSINRNIYISSILYLSSLATSNTCSIVYKIFC